MSEQLPEFRPSGTAADTKQPWGEHEVIPYTDEHERLWLKFADGQGSADETTVQQPDSAPTYAAFGVLLPYPLGIRTKHNMKEENDGN